MTARVEQESLHARDADADARAAQKPPHKPKPEVYNQDIPPVHGFTTEEAWAIRRNVFKTCDPDTDAAFVVEPLLGF